MGGWWYPGLAAVALGVAAIFAAQAVARQDRTASAAHALMAAAMAGMFWPAVNPLPAYAGAVAFVLVGVWFATVRLRSGVRGVDEPTHLAVGSAAMVVMYLGMHTASHAEGGGHAGHGGHAGTVSAGWLPAVVLGLAFAGYFVWHAWEIVAAPRPAEPAAEPTAARTPVLAGRRPRTAAHLVADGLMAVMFLGAL